MWLGQGPHLAGNLAQTNTLECREGRSPKDPRPPRRYPKPPQRDLGPPAPRKGPRTRERTRHHTEGTQDQPEGTGDPGSCQVDWPSDGPADSGSRWAARSHTWVQGGCCIPGPSGKHLAWLGVHGTFKWERRFLRTHPGAFAGHRQGRVPGPGWAQCMCCMCPRKTVPNSMAMAPMQGQGGTKVRPAWVKGELCLVGPNQDPEGPPAGKWLTPASSSPGLRHPLQEP